MRQRQVDSEVKGLEGNLEILTWALQMAIRKIGKRKLYTKYWGKDSKLLSDSQRYKCFKKKRRLRITYLVDPAHLIDEGTESQRSQRAFQNHME